jgi:ketosteroid isomerase-like protein
MFSRPEDAQKAFYVALARADIDGLMQVWAGDDEEIVCVHPGGLRLVGHVAVRESWESILKHGGLLIQAAKVSVLQTMVSTTYSLIEEIRAESPAGAEVAYCYATNVFHKGRSGWRMVMHHASPAPEQAGAMELHDTPGTLH